MLTLYVKTGCPYCRKVLEVLQNIDTSYNVRNIAEPEHLAELMEYGGQHQTPFLYSKEEDVNVYESDTIVKYLEGRFGAR